MRRRLLSHLQQFDILKIPDKLVSTAVAVRSVGLIFIVGDETQVGATPTASLKSGLPAASPLQPSQGQSYRRQTLDKTHKAKRGHIPGRRVQGKEKGRHTAYLKDVPDP